MLKKSTLLSVSVFFLLFLGLSDYGYGCHKGRPPHGNQTDCNGGGGGGDDDTTGGKSESFALIMTFDDMVGDNIQSDWMITGGSPSPYVNQEGASVGAAERSQPNPAAGIDLGLSAKKIKNRNGRQLDLLDITCKEIPSGEGNDCGKLSELLGDDVLWFDGFFPTCEDNNFCSLGASVKPYKVSCPEKLNGKCPDVFTMDPMKTELMSFRLSFAGGNLLIEVASAIGGDGGLDPGRCLSLLETNQRTAFLDLHCREPLGDPAECNVEVTAFDLGNAGTFPGQGDTEGAVAGDDENDAWQVVADGADGDLGVTALICNRNTSEVLGKATLLFGFKAIKKEGAIDPF